MKCKTCGYEVRESLTHCPMCGTRVSPDPLSSATTELSWNTRDFPKPKEMTDINMSWPEFNTKGNTSSISEEEITAALEKKRPVTLMSEDASEGYVSIPDKKENRPERKAAAPAPEKPAEEKPADQPYWYTQKFTATGVMQTGPAWPMAPGSAQSYPATAKIETMTLSDPIPIVPGASGTQENVNKAFTLSDLIKESRQRPEDTGRPSGSGFYTFQRKNDEFQKLLDREYDRIHAMHGDDYDPLRGTVHPFSSDQPVKAQELSAFEKLLLDEEEQAAEETPAQRFFTQDPGKAEEDQAGSLKDPDVPDVEVPTGDPTKYDIEKIENTIKELEAQEVIAENNRSERKKRLAAMAAAREAYFRSLDAIAAGKDPDEYIAPAPKEEEIPVYKPAAGPKEADLSALIGTDEGSVTEPTREVPVGGILEAITENKTVRAAALTAAAASVVSSEPFKTMVFKRLSDDAEERARNYEQPAEIAAEPAEAAMTPEELEADLFGRTGEKPADKFRTAARATIAGTKDAEKLATKYDLGEELKGIEAAGEVAETYEQPVEPFEIPAEEPIAEPAEVIPEPVVEPVIVKEPVIEPVETPVEEPAAEPFEEPIAEPVEAPAIITEPAIEPVEEPVTEPVEPAITEEPAEPSEPTQSFEPVSDDTSSLSFLYSENGGVKPEEKAEEPEEPADEETGSRHIFLKIIIAILLICALFELVVLGMSKFMPDAQATQTIVSVEEVIREAIVSAFNSAVEAIKGLFGK